MSLVNKLFIEKNLFHLKVEDGAIMVDRLNAFNTLVSQLASINIKMDEEDKFIALLCYFPKSWDNLVVAIGNATKFMSKSKDIVASLL